MKKQALIEQTGSFYDLLIESLQNVKKAYAYLQVALDEYRKMAMLKYF